ncbi:MAG: hypothetical protein OSA51_02440 [Octadecabacter sp.]|nr:hypothetical protein [Octadecabacter sp.]
MKALKHSIASGYAGTRAELATNINEAPIDRWKLLAVIRDVFVAR